MYGFTPMARFTCGHAHARAATTLLLLCSTACGSATNSAALGYVDGGVRFVDGGVEARYVDGGVAFVDGGVVEVHVDGGVALIDGGVVYVDGGVVVTYLDGGVVFTDGGVVEIYVDGGVVFIDGGVAFIDGGVIAEYVDGGAAVTDGGAEYIDGGVAYNDGGAAYTDGGVIVSDGGVAYGDGGVIFIDGGVPVNPRTCLVDPSVVWQEDFEFCGVVSPRGFWTPDNGTLLVGPSERCGQGSCCAIASGMPACTTSSLFGPPFTMPPATGGQGLWLTYVPWSSGIHARLVLQTRATTDAGVTWTDAVTGIWHGSSMVWPQQMPVEVTALAGQTVRFRLYAEGNMDSGYCRCGCGTGSLYIDCIQILRY